MNGFIQMYLSFSFKNYTDINIFSFQLMELHMKIVLPMEEVNQYKILGPYEIKQMLSSAKQTWFTSVSIKNSNNYCRI